MITFGYSRCSTINQSLEVQIDQLKQAGCEVIFGEKESGMKTDRKELAKLLKKLTPGDLVVVTALDRLGRSLKDILNVLDEITRKGAKFKSLKEPFFDTSSEMGKFLVNIIGSIAQLERSLIIERTQNGRRRAMDNGIKMGPKFRLTEHQQREALRRHQDGEMQSDIAKSYNVSPATICRLVAARS